MDYDISISFTVIEKLMPSLWALVSFSDNHDLIMITYTILLTSFLQLIKAGDIRDNECSKCNMTWSNR